MRYTKDHPRYWEFQAYLQTKHTYAWQLRTAQQYKRMATKDLNYDTRSRIDAYVMGLEYNAKQMKKLYQERYAYLHRP